MNAKLLFFVTAGVAAVASAFIDRSNPAPARPPNIILILVDDMGIADLGCYRNAGDARFPRDGGGAGSPDRAFRPAGTFRPGDTLVPTPNIDRLAAEGIRFTNYYSAAPICSPSRVGLTTGMAPGNWNITSYLSDRRHNQTCEQADFLTATAPTVAKHLKSIGYATAHFGKWHMGGGRDVTDAPGISQYGFDEYASTWESPNPDPLLTSTNWIWAKSDSIKRWNRTAYFVDKTLDFLKRNPGKPCYVNLWPDDVHTPWVSDEATLAEFPKGTEKPGEFNVVLAQLDKQIGRLLTGLQALGIDQNTLILFTSDNGALPTFGGNRSGAFRGSKLSLYEGGIRMPFLVRYPAQSPKGVVDTRSVICATDLLTTFGALAGSPQTRRGAGTGRGENVLAALTGKPHKRSHPIFWEYGRNDVSFNYPTGRDKSPNLAMRQGNWKLLVNDNGSGAELYDLARDPSETTNVAAQQPGIAHDMQIKLLAWRAALPYLNEQSGNEVTDYVTMVKPGLAASFS